MYHFLFYIVLIGWILWKNSASKNINVTTHPVNYDPPKTHNLLEYLLEWGLKNYERADSGSQVKIRIPGKINLPRISPNFNLYNTCETNLKYPLIDPTSEFSFSSVYGSIKVPDFRYLQKRKSDFGISWYLFWFTPKLTQVWDPNSS